MWDNAGLLIRLKYDETLRPVDWKTKRREYFKTTNIPSCKMHEDEAARNMYHEGKLEDHPKESKLS